MNNKINSFSDYKRFLQSDKDAIGAYTKYPLFSSNPMIWLTDPCWKFQKILRKLEYYSNCKNFGIYRIYIILLRRKFQKMSIDLGFSIPINVFDEGLCIVHYGSIVVSRHAHIGKNCTIHSCVNIGGTKSRESATIGDNCFIGPGVKIISDVDIGNNVKIGANSVVNKNFIESDITIVGIPAKIVRK